MGPVCDGRWLGVGGAGGLFNELLSCCRCLSTGLLVLGCIDTVFAPRWSEGCASQHPEGFCFPFCVCEAQTPWLHPHTHNHIYTEGGP
jgi:hypothetical protein